MDGNELAARIETETKEAFGGDQLKRLLRGWEGNKGSFGLATSAIKGMFAKLGTSLGFQVAAIGFGEHRKGERLYDMVWYNIDGGFVTRQAMVLESELNPGGGVAGAANVDYDFQKLIQAKADVRVWVCAIPNQSMLQAHLENCKAQIRRFAQSSAGDRFMFIIYDWTRNETFFERFDLAA